MRNEKYLYPAEKFSDARRCLMIPDEVDSIAIALGLCQRGLDDLDRDGLDEDALGWLCRLEKLMNPSGPEAPAADSDIAEALSPDEKRELSEVVDKLAHWFEDSTWPED